MKPQCFCLDLTEEEFAGLNYKELDFSGKTFYVSKTPMVSHFPMNPELKIEKTLQKIAQKGYQTTAPLFIIFEDGLLFGRILVEIVEPSVKSENVLTINNLKLMASSFAGPKFLVPKALKQFDRYLMAQKNLTTEFYFWYHSCKLCEKEKGGRTVILGKIK